MSRQEQPALVPLIPVSIQEWVRDRMHGFALRQAARAMKRKADRKRLAEQDPTTKERRYTGMRVIFRAELEGLKPGPLNPMALKMSGLRMTVDIFRKGDKWFARSNGNPVKLPAEITHGTMKDAVEACFTRRLSPWALLYAADEKPIDPDYVQEDPDGNFTMRDVTHVGNGDPKPASGGQNYYHTACGVEAHAALIVSKRGNHPPVCKECRKEWEKTPAAERFKK